VDNATILPRPISTSVLQVTADERARVWLVGGTRPEALKLAPVILAMESRQCIAPVVVATGQHPRMFHRGLAVFGLRPDLDLAVCRETDSQAEVVARIIELLEDHLRAEPPACVVVQGDTSTALAAALASLRRGIPVVHLEAGLRSHDLTAPFPEELNRRIISTLAELHLAPTEGAAANLSAEGVQSARIRVIGNTVVDAVLAIAARGGDPRNRALVEIAQRAGPHIQLVLATIHRRESWGARLRSVLDALRDLVSRHPQLVVVLPVHPNPRVRGDVVTALAGQERVIVTDPLDYPDLVWVLQRCALVLTDSGGIQEEAPSFGVPVIVLRDVTERMEGVDAGFAVLVGTHRARVVDVASRILDQHHTGPHAHGRVNPYGDGRAAPRAAGAVEALVARLRLAGGIAGAAQE
jgi:UDP-N-acetylglucosamine 2-epimerase (non-hydrolysing)